MPVNIPMYRSGLHSKALSHPRGHQQRVRNPVYSQHCRLQCSYQNMRKATSLQWLPISPQQFLHESSIKSGSMGTLSLLHSLSHPAPTTKASPLLPAVTSAWNVLPASLHGATSFISGLFSKVTFPLRPSDYLSYNLALPPIFSCLLPALFLLLGT